jgi:hydrogenase nickel incorporation protein HypB
MHETADEHLLEKINQRNDELAEHNREHFDELNILVVNLMSAPGAGKTTLLAHTIPALASSCKSMVIEGDMVGDIDAERLRAKGIVAHQISTGRSCHLDALMVSRLLHAKSIDQGTECIFIENVGNLVCPAEFNLGEHKRVVLLSVTEGDDKPLKYPVIFRNCDAVVFTKCDLLPYVEFNLKQAAEYVHNINDSVRTFAVSVKDGRGMDEWLTWLKEQLKSHRKESTCIVNR